MGVQIPHGKGQFEGEGRPIVKYRDTVRSSVQKKRLNRRRCRLVMGSHGPKESSVRWGSDILWKGVILRGNGVARCKVSQHPAMICAKWLNRSHLSFRLWTRVGRKKHKFNRIRQVAPMCPRGAYIGTAWWIRLNRSSAAAMRPYVNLLWPLVILIAVHTFYVRHIVYRGPYYNSRSLYKCTKNYYRYRII